MGSIPVVCTPHWHLCCPRSHHRWCPKCRWYIPPLFLDLGLKSLLDEFLQVCNELYGKDNAINIGLWFTDNSYKAMVCSLVHNIITSKVCTYSACPCKHSRVEVIIKTLELNLIPSHWTPAIFLCPHELESVKYWILHSEMFVADAEQWKS